MTIRETTKVLLPFLILISPALSGPRVLATTQGQSAEELYGEANDAYGRSDFGRAISLYERALTLMPDSVPVRTDLGVALAHVGRYEEAIVQYQEALKRDPKNPVVRLNLALALYKEAEFEKATGELERLLKEQPHNPQVLYLLADCYLRLGKNSEVAALLEPVYRKNPEDRAVDYALGTALIREGQVLRGESIIDRILRDGDTAEATLLTGEAQFAAGDYKTAATTLRKALDLDPNVPGGWSLYGRSLLSSEDPEGAKTAFQNALRADLNDFSGNLYLGSILRLEGKNAEAAPHLAKALRLRPRSPEAAFQMGALDAATGALDKARKEFERLEREWPDFLEVHVELANVYSRLKLKEDSQREQQIVLKLNEKAREKSTETKP